MKPIRYGLAFLATLIALAVFSFLALAILVFGNVSSMIIGLATVALAVLSLGAAIFITYEAHK